jgi:hypothetical protein
VGQPLEPEPVPLQEPAELAPEPWQRPEEAAVADEWAATTMVERLVRPEAAGHHARMWLFGMPRGAGPVPLSAPLCDDLWVVLNGHAGAHGLCESWAAAELAGATATGAICQGFRFWARAGHTSRRPCKRCRTAASTFGFQAALRDPESRP